MLTIDAFYAGLWWRQPQLFPSLSVQNPQPRGQVFQQYRTPSTICNFLYLCYIWVSPTGKTGGRGFRFYSVCQSIRLFVHSVSVHSVFGHFSVVLWYIYLKFCIKICLGKVQLRLLSHLTKFCVSYCRKQDLNVLYQVCVFFEPIGKSRWPHWPLIGWDIFDFLSETADGIQRNLTGSMVLTSSTQFVLFRADLKNKMAALASDWLTHFRLLCNRWTELNETWQEARFYSSFTEFVFFGPIGKTRGLPWPLIGWDIFDFVSDTAKQNLTKLDRKHDLNALYQVCGFFSCPSKKKKNKMAALASVLA